MDTLSLLGSIAAIIQLTNAVQQSLEQVARFRLESFSALQSEVTDLELILHQIEVIHTKTPNLTQVDFSSARLGKLNSTLIRLKELLVDSRNLVQVKDDGTSLSRSKGVRKEDQVRCMMFRIREERMALQLALSVEMTAHLERLNMQTQNLWYSLKSLDFQRHNSIKTATEQDLDSKDVHDSALQISRLEEPQFKPRDGFNRVYELHERFCDPKCCCLSHRRQRFQNRWQLFKSPYILSGLIGSLWVVQNITSRSRGLCEDADCACQAADTSESADISFMFPEWFRKDIITLCYSRTLRYGRQLSLRKTRFNPFPSSLYRAATKPHGLKYVKRLLKKDPRIIYEVDANGDTALHFAVRELNLEVVQLLVWFGADKYVRNFEGCSPYSIAWDEILTHKHAWEAETLSSWCTLFGEEALYDELDLPRLHRAYFGISHETFEEVLSAQLLYDINRRDRKGRTLLCWAAKIGDYETVSKLLSCGANPNLVDRLGFSPLHRSLQHPTSIISATVLLAANADINARSNNGHTALSIAAGQKDGNSGMTILLMFGANPESEDSKGRTPIFQAAENNKPKNVLYLVKAGANIGHVSAIGLTVIDEAIRKNSHEALRFLVPNTFPGKHGMIPLGEDTLYYAALWGDIETLEILAHGFWSGIQTNSIVHGHAAIGRAEFRRDTNKEWPEQYRQPPKPVVPRREWFAAFDSLVDTIDERQKQSIDEASDNRRTVRESASLEIAVDKHDTGENEEFWEDAKERVEENLLPEASHLSRQSQAIPRNCGIFTNCGIPRDHTNPEDYGIYRNYGSWTPLDCSSTCRRVSEGVSSAFSANKILENLSTMLFSMFEQPLPYVLPNFSWYPAVRLSAASPVNELSKRLARIFQTLEFSDPPLAEGKQRVRWRCAKCGRNMHDDFRELRAGAVKELEKLLNEGVSKCPDPNNNHNGADVPGESTSKDGTGLSQQPSTGENLALVPLSHTYDPRPQFRQQETVIRDCDAEGRWLLVCAKGRKRPTSLSHLDMCATSSDKELFTTLRDSYMAMRGKWSQRLSLKSVQKILFVKFELHIQDLVDVKFPGMPPKEKIRKEYLYEQYDTFPPVGENFMAHLFCHPEHANEMSITCLRAPKKLKEKLTICPLQGTREGWGIHLVEAWVISRVWLLISFLFLLGSLIFGVCWAILEHDIQGAFGVSGYMVTLVAVVVGTAQTNWADI